MRRWRYLGRKLVQVALTLYAVATFNFILFRILPGDPIRLLARSGHLAPEEIARLHQLFGLDQPLPVQYLIYLKNLMTGDLGMSLTYRQPVFGILAERIANTVLLLAAATVIVIVVGVVAGVFAASRRGSRLDAGTVIGSLFFWSLPTFWTGLILIIVLGVYFRAFPISGMGAPGFFVQSPLQHAVDLARHLVLPTLTLVLVDIGQFVLITRSSLIDVLTEDFMLTARAKGLSRRRILWRHGVRNALLPVATASALYVGLVIGGTIQVETVFSWPGMGRLIYDAVLQRDYPILEASFFIFAVVVILTNLASDLLYYSLDPRVRDV
ncbi:MAG: ABC transporter permease [Chloroflexi bacterium]|nr:ABC transporter permease [Chloroflexota bacterium]